MEITDTRTSAEGTIGYHGNMGWTIQEPPVPKLNDRGVRSMASLLQFVNGKRAKVTVTRLSPADARVYEGEVVYREDAAVWLVRGEPDPEHKHSGVRELADMLQWVSGVKARVVVEKIG